MGSIRHAPAARMEWAAAVGAGIVAGILATVVQIALWSAFTNALPAIIFRDSRFAAAIVLGRGVLPPPASFEWPLMLVATFVHFTLSIVYGIILARLISRASTGSSVIAGAVFGLCVYAVNLYGFTMIFPWFEQSRDWIALVTHVAFGMILAGAYRMLSERH